MKAKEDKVRILVLGINGQLGRQVFASLSNHYTDVYGSIRKSNSQEEQRAKILAIDLGDEVQIRSALRRLEPQIIVNCAAYTAVDQAEKEREYSYTINAHAPYVLAQEAFTLNALLVHISTDYVFDGSGSQPRSEIDRPAPCNHYGLAKLHGENNLASVGGVHAILRTCWVYSAQGNNFMKTMLRLGQAKESLRVVDDQVGSPTSVGELQRAIAVIVKAYLFDPKFFAKNLSGVYHAACQGSVSWYSFAQAIFALAREHRVPITVKEVMPIASDAYPSAARRPLNSRLDCTKFAKNFAFEFQDWRSALAETMCEYLANELGP